LGQPGYRRKERSYTTEPVPDKQPEAEAAGERGADIRSGSDRVVLQTVRVYPYGVARNRLIQAAKRLGVPVLIVKDPSDADVLVTLRTYYRKRQRTIVNAERRNMPIYVLRSNTIHQMQQFLSDLFSLYADGSGDPRMEMIVSETNSAIDAVMTGERWVELQPATSSIRRMQHQMAREAKLISHSYGKEPNRRVRIFRE